MDTTTILDKTQINVLSITVIICSKQGKMSSTFSCCSLVAHVQSAWDLRGKQRQSQQEAAGETCHTQVPNFRLTKGVIHCLLQLKYICHTLNPIMPFCFTNQSVRFRTLWISNTMITTTEVRVHGEFLASLHSHGPRFLSTFPQAFFLSLVPWPLFK